MNICKQQPNISVLFSKECINNAHGYFINLSKIIGLNDCLNIVIVVTIYFYCRKGLEIIFRGIHSVLAIYNLPIKILNIRF